MVKVHSLKLRAPSKSGPKTLRVFKNQPRTLDFSQAESFESIQDIELAPEILKGEKEISLKLEYIFEMRVRIISGWQF